MSIRTNQTNKRELTHSHLVLGLAEPSASTIRSVSKTFVDDRYELRAPAGSGGMADVYLAYDTVMDRDVALKLLKDRYAQDEEFVERFRREAKSAASLTNRHIVPIFDRGETKDGTYYIVMEYVPGGDLGDLIKSEGRLSPRRATEVALQVAEALQAAHKRGVVHRDIKPRNVLLTRSGHAKVADFGIARAAEATTISQPGDILGSAKYMSPEQAAGEPVGPQSDLYSLGVVLYEMLTETVPFKVSTPADVPLEHAKGPPRRPSEANPEVPEPLDAAVTSLLATDPQARYGSAGELLEELGRIGDDLPPVATSANEATTATLGDPLAPAPDPPASGSAGGTRSDRSSRRSLWILAAFAALIAVLGIAGWGMFRDSDGSEVPGDAGGSSGGQSKEADRAQPGPKKVEVPVVRGLAAQVARERLVEAGFKVEVREKKSSEEAAGRVVEQSIANGKEAEQGSKIVLDVGEGPSVATVPKLTGLAYSEAEDKLQEMGLPLGGVEEVPSDTVPAGVIVAQDPLPGSTLKKGAYVYLTTSVG